MLSLTTQYMGYHPIKELSKENPTYREALRHYKGYIRDNNPEGNQCKSSDDQSYQVDQILDQAYMKDEATYET
jgi:hypothetical protein